MALHFIRRESLIDLKHKRHELLGLKKKVQHEYYELGGLSKDSYERLNSSYDKRLKDLDQRIKVLRRRKK